MKKIIFIFVFSFFTSFLIAVPNLDGIIGDVISGNSLEAQQKIQALLDDYPNNGDVLYLQALLISDGNDALEIYKKIYKRHKNNKYADDAVMKIGEYYYVSGLYIQAAEWFKKIHMYYRKSEHLENGINLFLKCLIIAGSNDTASSYSQTFNTIFPKVKIDNRISESLKFSTDDIGCTGCNVIEEIKQENKKKQFTIQVGAYSKRENAELAMYNLRSVGYPSRIYDVRKKNKILHTVRCGFYEDRKSAEKIKKRLRIHLGYDPIIVSE